MTWVDARALVVAGWLWVGLHAVVALWRLGEARSAGLTLLALAAVLAGSAVALSRRWGPRLSRRLAWGLALVPATAAALHSPQLDGAHADAQATWWPRAVGPLLVVMGLAGRGRQAVVGAAAGTAVLWFELSARLGAATGLATTLLLAMPLWVWTLGGLGIHRLVVRSAAQVAALADAEAADRSREAAAVERGRAARARRNELQQSVVPVLHEVAERGSGGTVDAGLRRRCDELGQLLRDELRAPGLVDDTVRSVVAAARGRGVEVSLVDDARGTHPEDEGMTAVVRRLVVAAVEALPHGQVSARRPADDAVLLTVVVHARQEAVAAVARAMRQVAARHRLAGLELDVGSDGEGGELFAQLRGRPPTTPR